MFFMHLFVYVARFNFCPFSFPWSQGLAAVYDCGTPWTILLTFLLGQRKAEHNSKLTIFIK